MKQKYYFDIEPKVGQFNVISIKKNRASGQGESIKVLKIKGKLVKIKTMENFKDKKLNSPFWVIRK